MNFKTIARSTIGVLRSFIPNRKPALNDLDNKLAKYLNFSDGVFIEAGANDGYSQSNTYYLEKCKGWRGILVERIPELFNRCEKNRPAADVFNYALVGDDTEIVNIREGKVPAIKLEKILNVYPNLPPIDFLSLDVEGGELAALKGLNLLKYRPRYILVECNFYEEVDSFLTSMGYKQVEKLTHNDCLYKAT